MKLRSVLWHVLLVCTMLSENAVGQTQIERLEVVKVPGVTATLLSGPLLCDSSSSIYLQPVGERSILKISNSGRDLQRLPLPVKSPRDVADFAVNQEGELQVLVVGEPAYKEGKVMVPKGRTISVRGDGKVSGDSELNLANFSPYRFAPLGRASFFVIGGLFGRPDAAPDYGAWIFGANGEPKSKVSSLRQLSPGFSNAGGLADTVSIAAGSDGRVYIKGPVHTTPKKDVKNGQDTIVHVINQAGSLEKEIHVHTPEGFSLIDLKESGGHLVALLAKADHPEQSAWSMTVQLVTLSAADGEELARYTSPHLGTAFACYRTGAYTFIRAGLDGTMELWSFKGI